MEPAAPEPGVGGSPDSGAGRNPPAPTGERRLRPPTLRVCLLAAGVVATAGVLFLAGPALAPFVVGLLLLYLLTPPVDWLAARGLPRSLSILLVYVLLALGIYTLLRLTLTPLLVQIQDFIQHLPDAVTAVRTQLTDFYQNLDVSPEVRRAIDRLLADVATGAGTFNPTSVLPVVTSVAGIAISLFGYFILPAWLFYLLKDRPALEAAFGRSLPETWRPDAWAIVRIVDRVIGQWVRGQLLLGVFVGLTSFVGLLVLSATVDPQFGRFAILLALVSGLFELIPIIGPILATIPAVLVGLSAGPQQAVAVLILYFGIQLFENNVLVPKIQSDAVRLHPSVVMVALVAGGAIGGLIGAILSLPITAVARDVFRYMFRRLADPPVPVEEALEEVIGPETPVAEEPPEPVPPPLESSADAEPIEPSRQSLDPGRQA